MAKMALSNYTLSYSSGLAPSPFVAPAIQNQNHYSDLLYPPEAHQPTSNIETFKNDPYATPEQHQRQDKRLKYRKRGGSTYLPPQNQYTSYSQQEEPSEQQYQSRSVYNQPRLPVEADNQRLDVTHEGYREERYQDQVQRRFEPFNGYPSPGVQRQHYSPPAPPTLYTKTPHHLEPPRSATPIPQINHRSDSSVSFSSGGPSRQQPTGFTKVEAGGSDGKTRLHAVLDYDDGDYYDDGSQNGGDEVNVINQQVTPLQGPILLKNGTVPVVPLFSYPTVNNGTLFQIPILWTALSVALGYELQGQLIKGVPCVKRNYQLYCPTAGNTYPLAKIEHFIDENKALMKRMYGAFSARDSGGGGIGRRKRAPGVPDPHLGDSYFRHVRQATPPPVSGGNSSRVDACESKTEIVTPYWALNSARKLRAIVNTMHFEQAIHQEVCSKKSTSRCSGDCGCEQKYKWHRLLAYDPDEDCSGIFMDWFLFPSCCVCRCDP